MRTEMNTEMREMTFEELDAVVAGWPSLRSAQRRFASLRIAQSQDALAPAVVSKCK